MAHTQAGRRLKVTTPLGADVLLMNGLTGHEAISTPFFFQVECVAENDKAKQVTFDALLGQKITVEIALPGGSSRFLNGTCLKVAEGARDAVFTRFVLDLVPEVFLFSRKTQSRIFQQITVPDILKKVLAGFDVAYEIQGSFQQRDYCVQYRESDFAFASRLMEEEGIYYFFKHAAGSHTMVVANAPSSHPGFPGPSNLIFDAVGGGSRDEDRVRAWEKSQELKSSKVVLWDHSFELPHKHLDPAPAEIQASVVAGKASHKLKLAANAKLELYDFPGRYAQRFDGIAPGGGERPADVQKIFQDNARTAELRIQEQAAASVLVRAVSNCRQVVSGHKFTLERHFDGDGPWVVYQVEHAASDAADLRSGAGGFTYQNHFTCFPAALPFRPPRTTPVPVVQGTQTAVVVGPPGEEIFTDKYGRIKVQFHWDRDGKNNSDSSCWVRVATSWAGRQWGAIHIPRVGQEVVVDFLEGDPDQPIVIGSVYNADMMPPYGLPANKTQSGIKSRSSLGGAPANFNEIRFEDKKGNELLTIHAERNQSISVEADESHTVGHDRSKSIGHDETTTVSHDRTETVGNNETITIAANRTETVAKNETITIGLNRTELVGTNETVTIGATRTETIGAADVLTVGGARTVTVGGAEALTVGGSLVVNVGEETTVTVGTATSKLVMKKDGTIELTGKDITVKGSATVKVSAPKVEIKGDASVDIESGGPVTVKGNPIKLNC